MEVLVLDGKNYVKASKAAKDLGYATDYVGQLCRSGKVDSHLIGRTWYVNQEELSTHRVEKKRMSRVKAREHAKRTIEEYRKQNDTTQKTYNSLAIQYEPDAEVLIPETRKISVVSEKSKKNFDRYGDEGDKKEVVNKGAKVRMEGSLNVVDVTDGDVDEATTVLKPRIYAGIPEPVLKKKVIDDIPVTLEEASVTLQKSFVEKLEDKAIYVEEEAQEDVEPIIEKSEEILPLPTLKQTIHREKEGTKSESGDISIGFAVVVIVVCTCIVSATLPLSKIFTYTRDESGTVSVNTGISFSIEKAKQLIVSKI